MSSEIFDKNVGDLIRNHALRPDEARAKERFLREAGAPPERLSWKLAAAAAAVVVAVVMVWSARIERRAPVVTTKELPPAPVAVPSRGGDGLLEGSFMRKKGGLVFEGKSPLPDGLVFTMRISRLEEQLRGERLALSAREGMVSTIEIQKGALVEDWGPSAPGPVKLDVAAPDALQDTAILKRMRVPESARRWSFEVDDWDAKLPARLAPQLAELADFAREARELVAKVEEACASEALFKERKKELGAAAAKLQSRVEAFAKSGIYPAAASQVAWTVRDLGQAMEIFTWKGSKYDGPRSYYTNGDLQKTYQNEAFSFEALRRYLDRAVRIAGRELALWAIKDLRRWRHVEEVRAALRDSRSEFMAQLVHEQAKYDELEAEIRVISK